MSGSVAVETEFSWGTFVERYWDRSPVLFRSLSLSPAPFAAGEVFRAAVDGSRSARLDGRMPSHMQFMVERVQRDISDDLLPTREDGSFDAYDARLAARLDGRRHALVVNSFHTFDAALWSRERAFFAGLWDVVGLPLTGAITTLFHGTYEHSPVGVHKDRFATFMFGLRGRKRMRFWPRKPWNEPVSTKVDYADHSGESFTADVGPGDLLYWPADYYHVGESATAAPATSVNVGVPREEHHVGYELEALLADLDPNRLTGRSSLDNLLPVHDVPLTASGPGVDGLLSPTLPEGLTAPVGSLHAFAQPDRIARRVTAVSLRRWTAGGFEPVPAAVPPRPLAGTDRLRADRLAHIVWGSDSDGGTLCAANGHHTRTPLEQRDVHQLTQALATTGPVAVAVLLGAVSPGVQRDATRALLQQLESFGALHREP
ncbi:JmjC domain-containing protein [Streptomyces sp. AK08-02]|uniref:JmjC domain-containing protein n=1 Tax=Streptomyces sp. AK08-02 TaxID=3028654 RepID=UPI0029B83D81|nr:cupin domain-containing protein [Streptomyces sp. AK08-02]MDX3748232.1 cupin [Streptomyces sp. AK08-02]